MMSEEPARKKQRLDTFSEEDAEVDFQDASERACDACRRRRVKCDKNIPCSNCRRRKEDCRTTVAPQSEPRARGFLTKAYEGKIDEMSARLANVENLLQQQQSLLASLTYDKSSTPRGHSGKAASSSASTVALPSPESQPAAAVDQDVYDATTGSHSTVAHKLVEKAVEDSPGTCQDSELIAALNSLKDMVSRMEDGAGALDVSGSSWRPLSSGPDQVDLPTAAEMRRLLQEASGSIAMGFTPGLTASALKEKTEHVLQSGSDASAIRRTYVYGTLRNLCIELGGQHKDHAFAIRCKSLSIHFSVQLGHAVDDLKLAIPATAEAASALTIASGAAMELCKPVVAQNLSSKAASIVLSLGYNRWSSMRSDSEPVRQIKIFIFWMAWWLDTSFSVRLGRAPIIRPHDIAVPQLSEDSIVPTGWCKVVEQLYTPAAVKETTEERSKRASQLLHDLDEAREARGTGPNAIALWEDSDAIMHYSTVCLVKHATMTSGSAESPALESARLALRLNVDAWETHKHLPDFIWAGHCHWTLLKGPITPFVVTFCHIVAHAFTAAEDLQLLGDFVRTLAILRRFSDGMIRLHKLCDVFCKVATLYVQAKTNETCSNVGVNNGTAAVPSILDQAATTCIGQPAVNDIDGYLSTIGFAAPQPTNNANGVYHENGDLGEVDPNFLMDWYQGNNSLMGFLEQDLAFTGDLSYDYMSGPPT